MPRKKNTQRYIERIIKILLLHSRSEFIKSRLQKKKQPQREATGKSRMEEKCLRSQARIIPIVYYFSWKDASSFFVQELFESLRILQFRRPTISTHLYKQRIFFGFLWSFFYRRTILHGVRQQATNELFMNKSTHKKKN